MNAEVPQIGRLEVRRLQERAAGAEVKAWPLCD